VIAPPPEEAIKIAREVGALAQEGDAHRVHGVDLAFLGDLEAGVTELREARRISEAVGRVDELARCTATLSGLLVSFGEFEAAATVALQGADSAASHGLGRWHSPFLTATAGRAVFALGRWDEADMLLQRAADRVAPELAATRVFICAARGELDIARGRASAAAEHLAEARDAYAQTVKQPWLAGPLFSATAELALLEGRLADADAAVSEGLRLTGTDLGFAAPLYALGVRAAANRAELARAHRNEDDVLEACQLGNALGMELAERMSSTEADAAAPTPHTAAYAATSNAERARLGGRSEPDMWKVAAEEAWERLAEPHRAAYARYREVEALLLAGVSREQVEVSLRTAYATARQLGALPLCTEIVGLGRRGRLNLETEAPTKIISEPSPLARLGLTVREQEVLALLATGQTNRQIAETLFISPKTATLHVSNILSKLGVTNRVEAATIAHRLGVVSPDA
jgi:DNA-binding CsgD family transcriptional regulator